MKPAPSHEPRKPNRPTQAFHQLRSILTYFLPFENYRTRRWANKQTRWLNCRCERATIHLGGNDTFGRSSKAKRFLDTIHLDELSSRINIDRTPAKLAPNSRLNRACARARACVAKDAAKEMERGAIPCTKFILLNQQVVRRSLVRCCSVRSRLHRNEPKFPWEFFNPFDANDDYIVVHRWTLAVVVIENS